MMEMLNMNKGECPGHTVDIMFEELFCGRMGSHLFVLEWRANRVERVPRRHILAYDKEERCALEPSNRAVDCA